MKTGNGHDESNLLPRGRVGTRQSPFYTQVWDAGLNSPLICVVGVNLLYRISLDVHTQASQLTQHDRALILRS